MALKLAWNVKYRLKENSIQMDNFRGMVSVKRIAKMKGEGIREMCGMKE